MTFETIEFEIHGGGATLTLNRPDRLNSFNVQMHEDVQSAFDIIEKSDEIRALLITGSGRGFCAGQDLSDRTVAPASEAVDVGASVEKYYNPLIRRITSLPMPVICAVNGVAAGVGANIALACDIVLAARTAKFIQSFANIGLIPDSGGTWVLPRLIGQARALAISLTGEPVGADTAENWGMIWKSVEPDDLMSEATSLLMKFATGPTLGLAETKLRIRSASMNSLDDELNEQRDAMRRLGYSADYAEGVTAFMEKRKPVFKGE